METESQFENPFGVVERICLRNTPWRDLEELRASMDEKNLNYVQFLFPYEKVTMDQLQGTAHKRLKGYDRGAFTLARLQSRVCKTADCGNCSRNGNMAEVIPYTMPDGTRVYVVDELSGKCPKWRAMQPAREAPVETEPAHEYAFGGAR